MKKLIYIGGCGRSGSTILGLTLGNIDQAVDLGEVIDFARFEGKPNGFDVNTANYAFWQQIIAGVSQDIGECNWPELRRLTSRYDSHAGLLLQLVSFGIFPRRNRAKYYAYISSLYRRIANTEGVQVFVDGSKYAGRLYHLGEILGNESMTVVHLIRNPFDVARSMQSTLQGAGKSWIMAMTYYFSVNLLMKIVIGVKRFRHVVIRYEDFVARPEHVLHSIGAASQIDVASLVDLVTNNIPLKRGYIFNGNRMRMHPSVALRRSNENSAGQRSTAERLIIALSDWMFCRKRN